MMAPIAVVAPMFAIHRASVPAHTREVGSPRDPKRPFEGRKTGKWLITWTSIAKILGTDVDTARRDALLSGRVRRLVLSVRETAEILGVSDQHIFTMISLEELDAVKLANEWKIPVYVIAKYQGTSAEKFIVNAKDADDRDVAV